MKYRMGRAMIYGVLLVIVFAQSCTAISGRANPGTACYICENCGSNAEALETWTYCYRGQACSSAFTRRTSGEVLSVRKRCVNRCSFPGTVYNISSRGFRYCCTEDFCNEGLEPRVPNPGTPIVSTKQLKGEKGNSGIPGLPGIGGRDGFPGLPGQKGERGPMGPPGPKGVFAVCETGNMDAPCAGGKGEPGDWGLPGENGEPGDPGLPGIDGERGRPGNSGRAGFPGETGYVGRTGYPGSPGLDGIPGQKGDRGECNCPAVGSSSKTVAFHGVAANARQTSPDPEPLVFREVFVNENGKGSFLINTSDSAEFEVPQSGFYVFHVSSVANGNKATPLVVHANNSTAMEVGQPTGSDAPLAQINNRWMLRLEAGDEIDLMIPGIDDQDDSDLVLFNRFSSPSEIAFSVYRIQ